MNTEAGILLSEFIELSRRIAKVVEIYWQDEYGKRHPIDVDELKGILG